MSFSKTTFPDMRLSELSDVNYRLAVSGYEADALCTQLARAIIRRMHSEHDGKCWLVNTMNRTITPYTQGMVRNFACDFVLPRYDAAVADALADLKGYGLNIERLGKLDALIRNVNGEHVFWL